jgi:hypothetical protein
MRGLSYACALGIMGDCRTKVCQNGNRVLADIVETPEPEVLRSRTSPLAYASQSGCAKSEGIMWRIALEVNH